MAPRSTWKGFLKLSLVSVPVKAYTATVSGGGEIHLNQLHKDCNSRINYKKTCPIHGEVSNDEIVSGYEYAKGQYVVVDPEEVDKLRTADDKAIKIDAFISADELDPMYQSGRTYYLVPDGPVGLKPYSVIREGMMQMKRQAVANVVLHGKEQVVLVRPIDGVLGMTVLSHDAQITKPSAFESEVPKQEASEDELKLVKTLIDASTKKKFDFSVYKDTYTEKLSKLIEAKVAGEELVTPPAQEHAQIINLMDALKQSVAMAKGAEPAEAEETGKPPKKMAPSKGKGKEAREPAARKRKSSGA